MKPVPALTNLGPYRLDRELGAGGMGRVFRAVVDGRAPGLDVGAVVALKVVHPHLLETPGFFKRFLREGEVGRAVVHENVVRTFDCDAISSDGAQQHFLVMEYVEGQTLRGLLDELERVPEELCRHIGREVAKGLAAIHAAGVIHRDVKPENVLITADHRIKVMDLGVARLRDEAVRLSQTGAFVGSLHYAAPESFRDGGRHVDGRADLHALGLVLYELACGVNPYFADDVPQTLRKVLHETPRRLGDVHPQLSPFFEEVVHTLLAKDPAERFADAAALVSVLGEGEASAWWTSRAKAIRAATRKPLRRIRIPRETAVYGRDAEIAKLRALFEKAKSGDGQVVLIEGEAGIGKSRLVDELVGRLQQGGEDLNFLFGGYPPGGAAAAAGAFSTALREHLGDADLEAAVRERLGPAAALAPAFAALLVETAAPAGAVPLTRDSLRACFVAAVRSLGAERPTVLLVDDLHFATEDSRSLFTALAMAVPGHRVLLVGTTRPGIDETWLAGLTRLPHVVPFVVARLGPKDLVRLLADTLGSVHLAEELSGRIALKSDGNPFFVFEILRGLREGRFLTRRDDGSWATTRILADIEIPSSVLDLVKARVADLSEEDRDLLDVAACQGFEFDPLLVGEALGIARIPLLKRLAQIERAHRLVRSAGERFVFDHHQVQEALYGSIPELLRREYHAALGAALEARSGAGAAANPEALDGALCVDLAEHFLRGGAGARALRYLDAAVGHLAKAYLAEAGFRLVERALAVPGLLTGEARMRTLPRLAVGAMALGRVDVYRATCEEALGIARAIGHRRGECVAMGNLGSYFRAVGRFAEAREHMERCIEIAREIGAVQDELRASGNLGGVLFSMGRIPEALERFERGLELSRGTGNREGEVYGIGNVGSVLQALGRLGEAKEHHERALALARELSNLDAESAATINLGVVLAKLGRLAEAADHHERGARLARQCGNRMWEVNALGCLGDVQSSLGRMGDAREHYARQLALALEVGNRSAEATAIGNLGAVLLVLGRVEAAREHAERCLALVREIGERQLEGHALVTLAGAAAEQGDAARAVELLSASFDLRRSIGVREEEADSLLARGVLLAHEGRTAEARADFELALSTAREHALGWAVLAASACLATLPGGDAAAALAALAAHDESTTLRTRMDARFQLWRATGDRAHLAEAKRLLEHLVAHAPPDCRESMVASVRLHREIAAAWAAEGTA